MHCGSVSWAEALRCSEQLQTLAPPGQNRGVVVRGDARLDPPLGKLSRLCFPQMPPHTHSLSHTRTLSHTHPLTHALSLTHFLSLSHTSLMISSCCSGWIAGEHHGRRGARQADLTRHGCPRRLLCRASIPVAAPLAPLTRSFPLPFPVPGFPIRRRRHGARSALALLARHLFLGGAPLGGRHLRTRPCATPGRYARCLPAPLPPPTHTPSP